MSEITELSLMLASSSVFCRRWTWRVHSRTVSHRDRDFEDGIGASTRRNARASEVKYTCSAEIRD